MAATELQTAKAMEQTRKHIQRVGQLLHNVIKMLLDRIERHDQSKLESPEVELFAEYTEKLEACTYDSPEYKQFLTEMKPALAHHYAHNRHHPEYFAGGLCDMTLLDLVEMICDWKAATERHADGNIAWSLSRNRTRFEIGPQLQRILENTRFANFSQMLLQMLDMSN